MLTARPKFDRAKQGRVWYNSCKSSYYTYSMAGRSAGCACSRPNGQLYHSALLHGIITAKAAIILVLWPDDPQAVPAPVPMANYTIPLCFMV